MELIQIGAPQPQPQAHVSVREMFERLAQQEAEMVRAARERMREGIPGCPTLTGFGNVGAQNAAVPA